MDVKLIFAASSLHFLALLTPGPDFILTLKNTLKFGQKSGLATALGFGAGILVHVSYSILGLSWLIRESPRILEVMNYLGASYLIWLGIGSLLLKRPTKVLSEPGNSGLNSASARNSFTAGLLTNLFNPKASLFVVGIFTSFIPAETKTPTLLSIGGLMVILTSVWFTVVAFFFSRSKIRVTYEKIQNPLDLLFSFFFIGAGIALIWQKLPRY